MCVQIVSRCGYSGRVVVGEVGEAGVEVGEVGVWAGEVGVEGEMEFGMMRRDGERRMEGGIWRNGWMGMVMWNGIGWMGMWMNGGGLLGNNGKRRIWRWHGSKGGFLIVDWGEEG